VGIAHSNLGKKRSPGKINILHGKEGSEGPKGASTEVMESGSAWRKGNAGKEQVFNIQGVQKFVVSSVVCI